MSKIKEKWFALILLLEHRKRKIVQPNHYATPETPTKRAKYVCKENMFF